MYQQAEVVGLLRTILIILLIWFSIRLVMRYVFPFILKYAVRRFERKVNERMRQGGGNAGSYDQADNEGNVYVKRPPRDNSGKPKDFDGGEYVDFEEVE